MQKDELVKQLRRLANEVIECDQGCEVCAAYAKDALAALAVEAQEPVVSGKAAFTTIVKRELPPNTIISDPEWWAERLWRWAQQARSFDAQPPEENVRAEPVAWGVRNTAITGKAHSLMMVRLEKPAGDDSGNWVPLYAAPIPPGERTTGEAWIERLEDAAMNYARDYEHAESGPPTDFERMYVEDAIAGLLADDDFMRIAREGAVPSPQPLAQEAVRVKDIVAALEGWAANTDTDPRWVAASELRRLDGWESRTLRIAAPPAPLSLSEIRKDAERYRWLRQDNATEFGEPWAITRYSPGDERNSDGGTCPLNYEELDAAIDAALQAAAQEGEKP